MTEKLNIIIAAGGSSQRYGEADKLQEKLGGLPVLLHSIRNFYPYAAPHCLVVAANRNHLALYRDLAEKYLPGVDITWVPGGDTRTASVSNAIAALPDDEGLVAIHDAARPLATGELLLRVAGEAARTGGAIAASKVVDTIKSSADGKVISATVDRSLLWRAETPQVFRLKDFIAACRKLGNQVLTDDAETMRLAGFPVALVESGCFNGKLTSAGDLEVLEKFFPEQQ